MDVPEMPAEMERALVRIKRVFMTTSIGTSVLQFMARDIAHGFRRLGLDVYLEHEMYPGKNVHAFHIMKAVQWFKPDLVFRMGHVRAEDSNQIWGMSPDKEGAFAWDGKHVHASWIQDALSCHFEPDGVGKPVGRHLVKDFGPRDIIFTSFHGLNSRFIEELGFPKARVHHLQVGANFDMFFPETPPPDEFRVVFPCNPGHPATSQNPRRLMRRQDPVRWLIELGVPVDLYGEGWEKNDTFRPHWKGMVANGPDLRGVYCSGSAVLQANTDLCLSHQRVYETQACGRPVLLYARPEDVDEIATSGHPGIIPFYSKDDLPAAIEQAKAWSMPPGEYGVFREENDYPARCRRVLEICEPLL